jgi:hypothetical protein
MVSSMSAVRTVSTLTREVPTRLSCTVARTISPVRPMPPAVAQKRPGSDWLVTVRGSPLGSTRSTDRTCRAKLPATWWFLPCTSAAIAPPTVTCLVPGETGTNHPAGSPATMSCSRLTPASQVARPVAGSSSVIRFSLAVEITTPPSDCAALL